jgi:hypothetical protein
LASAWVEPVVDLGVVEAVLAVEFADLAHVVGQDPRVQHGAGLGGDGRQQIVGIQFLRAPSTLMAEMRGFSLTLMIRIFPSEP